MGTCCSVVGIVGFTFLIVVVACVNCNSISSDIGTVSINVGKAIVASDLSICTWHPSVIVCTLKENRELDNDGTYSALAGKFHLVALYVHTYCSLSFDGFVVAIRKSNKRIRKILFAYAIKQC